ncbi:MAG: LysR family transcriptional regulator [Myxococcales bacterium]|nr:LysR family transcriptional regulator [Myxococcales bacterium]MCB9641515.1 LysR family transcriptional regulator [Myxococcales bacterium]
MDWSSLPVTLRQMQYLLAVAEHGGFRRAAEVCHVSQPALSTQVAQVEEALGVIFFERQGRGVHVTAAGELLLTRIRVALRAAHEVVEQARALAEPFSGDLYLGVIPTLAPYLLPLLVPLLRKEYPHLSVHWVEQQTSTLMEALHTGELDAALVALEAELGEVAAEELGWDAFVLVAHPDHPLARQEEPLTEAALKGHTVLVLDDGHCLRDQVLEVCTRHQTESGELRATSLATLLQMVGCGLGVTLLPHLALRAEKKSHASLCFRSFQEPRPGRTLGLVWRPTYPQGDAMRSLAKYFRSVIQSELG